MKSIKESMITFGIVGLFIVAFLTFAFTIEQDNGVVNGLSNNSILNKSVVNLTGTFSSLESKANSENEGQDVESPLESSGSLVFFSIISAGKTIKSIIIGVFNAIIIIPASILGISSIVTGLFGSILILTLVLLAWRLYKAGE